ncbi:hypothetical protein ACFSO7_16725 [Bacillus sp. CGMCC 1.16607]|uniref:hypothetical protein n=1 Tax=Bacillus sp. CGMCC 1.16607 TaxID=3351842 RepID=UPI0036382479
MNKQNWISIFSRKKQSNGMGMLLASLLSIVVSAIALFFLKKDEKGNPFITETNKIPKNSSKTDIQKFLTMNDRAVLAEFASELEPKTNIIEYKSNQ